MLHLKSSTARFCFLILAILWSATKTFSLADSTVYLYHDKVINLKYTVQINGAPALDFSGDLTKETDLAKYYSPAVLPLNITGSGPVLVTVNVDFDTPAGPKQYYAEHTIDVIDGQEYYLEVKSQITDKFKISAMKREHGIKKTVKQDVKHLAPHKFKAGSSITTAVSDEQRKEQKEKNQAANKKAKKDFVDGMSEVVNDISKSLNNGNGSHDNNNATESASAPQQEGTSDYIAKYKFYDNENEKIFNKFRKQSHAYLKERQRLAEGSSKSCSNTMSVLLKWKDSYNHHSHCMRKIRHEAADKGITIKESIHETFGIKKVLDDAIKYLRKGVDPNL